MNIELEIISNIVESGDLRKAKVVGITADFFRTSLGQEAWSWLNIEAERPETFGEVPDKTRLLRRFPDFSYHPTNNSLNSLFREASDMYLDKDTHAIVDHLQTMLEDDFDATSVIVEGIEKLRDLQASSVRNDGNYLKDAAMELKARYMKRKETDGVTGMPFPYACLNAMTGGMSPGSLIYIYGRPGMMKSWLLCVFAAHQASMNKKVMLYTKEIDDFTLMERVASIMLKLDYSKYRDGHLPKEQEDLYLDYLEQMANDQVTGEGNLFFVTDKGQKTPRTVDKLMAIAERVRPDIIFIDGFYLLNPGRANERKSDHEKIKAISRSIKGYAQSLNVPIVCTSQANRDGKKNITVGQTDDAAFSDAVGQDADIMLRCYKGPNPTVHGGNSLLVIPKKVREGGSDGVPKAFIINANPSYDWSLQQFPANPTSFIQNAEEFEKQQGNSIPAPNTVSAFRTTKPRKSKGNYKT